MRAKLLVVGAAVLSIGSLCLLDAPKTAALPLTDNLSTIVQTLTNPVTSLLHPTKSDTTNSPPKTDKPTTTPADTSSKPVNEAGGNEQTSPAPSEAVTTEPLELPARSTQPQAAPPPATAAPAYTKELPRGITTPGLTASVQFGDQSVRGVMIERTSSGWRIAGVLWYEWLLVALLLVLAGATVWYQVKSLRYQSILSKK